MQMLLVWGPHCVDHWSSVTNTDTRPREGKRRERLCRDHWVSGKLKSNLTIVCEIKGIKHLKNFPVL